MPIRRRGTRYQVRVQSAGGRIARTFANRRDAQEFEARYRQRVADHRVGRAPRIGIEEALQRWLTGEATGLRSHANLLDKARAIFPYIEGRPLSEVADVAEEIAAAGLRQGLAPATINRRLAILRRVANLAFRRWGLLEQPLGQRITMVPGERARTTHLSPAQVQRVASLAPSPAGRDAILLAAMSGLRLSELLHPDLRREGAALVVPPGKNGKSRLVPLPAEALGLPVPLAITERELRREWEAARAQAGLQGVRWHDLRHTYATLLIASGADLAAVRDLLGHSNIGVTSKYLHAGLPGLARAVAGFPSVTGAARDKRGTAKRAKPRKKAA